MKKFIPFAIAGAFALGACASSGGTGGEGSSSVNDKDAATAILAAEHEQSRAKAKGFEWRDTEKLIKEAQKAAKEGKFDDAVKLANKAKNQSTNAIAQAEEQKNAGPRL